MDLTFKLKIGPNLLTYIDFLNYLGVFSWLEIIDIQQETDATH